MITSSYFLPLNIYKRFKTHGPRGGPWEAIREALRIPMGDLWETPWEACGRSYGRPMTLGTTLLALCEAHELALNFDYVSLSSRI